MHCSDLMFCISILIVECLLKFVEVQQKWTPNYGQSVILYNLDGLLGDFSNKFPRNFTDFSQVVPSSSFPR